MTGRIIRAKIILHRMDEGGGDIWSTGPNDFGRKRRENVPKQAAGNRVAEGGKRVSILGGHHGQHQGSKSE